MFGQRMAASPATSWVCERQAEWAGSDDPARAAVAPWAGGVDRRREGNGPPAQRFRRKQKCLSRDLALKESPTLPPAPASNPLTSGPRRRRQQTRCAMRGQVCIVRRRTFGHSQCLKHHVLLRAQSFAFACNARGVDALNESMLRFVSPDKITVANIA